MKNFAITTLFTCIFSAVFAQSDCANPTPVTICPTAKLVGETNLAMGDNAPSGCNSLGEDKVYKLTAPAGTDALSLFVENATEPYTVIVEENSCNSTCTSQNFSIGNSDIKFLVGGGGTYFIWIDSPAPMTYDISFGGTESTAINIPDTRGNWNFDGSGCATPMFSAAKPFFQVHYNGVAQTLPMTLAPLSVSGSMCVTLFLQNPTGDEGVKSVSFSFGPDYAGISPGTNFPGNYNAGTWQSSGGGKSLKWSFADAAATGRGDFGGSPNTCLSYTFCFNVTPLSNIPANTNVDVTCTSDGEGSPFSGTLITGCCANPALSCTGMFAGGGATASATIGFGFDDPGTPLDAELLSFTAEQKQDIVDISWSVVDKSTIRSFDVERSADANNWTSIDNIEADGAQGNTGYYSSYDQLNAESPGTLYYRLKINYSDATHSYGKVATLKLRNTLDDVNIYPNPARDQLNVQADGIEGVSIRFINYLGEVMELPMYIRNDKLIITTAGLNTGIYFVEVYDGEKLSKHKVAIR